MSTIPDGVTARLARLKTQRDEARDERDTLAIQLDRAQAKFEGACEALDSAHYIVNLLTGSADE